MEKVLCDREISAKLRPKIFLQSFVRSRICYSVQAWELKEKEIKLIESKWHGFLRRMVNLGFKRKEDSTVFKYSNDDLVNVTYTENIRQYVKRQQLNTLLMCLECTTRTSRKNYYWPKNILGKFKFGKRLKENIRYIRVNYSES